MGKCGRGKCHVMTDVNIKVGYNVKSEVSNHQADCLNQDLPR